MTLFPDRPERPRIAVFSGFAFPTAAEVALYAELDALANALGAEVRVCHSVVPDPRSLDAGLRARLGTGLFVPQNPDMHGNDVAHFQHTQAARCDSLIAALTRFAPAGPEALLARPQVQESFGFARWVQAWGADLVVSCGLADGSLQAFVAAHLLDLPRVVMIDDVAMDSEYGQLLPLHVEQARVLLAVGPRVRDDLVARFAARVAAKLVVTTPGELAAPAVRFALGEALATPRSATAPRRGPAAAFVTRLQAPVHPRAARPFLVLGAERTGSNMLVAMLEVRPGIACANELFNPRLIAEGDVPWLANSGVSREELLRLRSLDPAGLLDRLFLDGAASGAGWVGFKLLYGHGTVDDRVVDALAADRDLAVVHLLRADRLQRWLSLARARAKDEWFARSRAVAPVHDEPIVLDPQATATEFALGELFEERFRAVFRGHRVLELDYEDLAQHLPQAARRLGAFLGCELGEMVPRSHKTGSRDLGRVIANLAELRAAFAGTRWADLTA